MKEKASYQKLRGGYYTPRKLAVFLSKWAIRSQSDCILEPSCGDGIFIEAAANRLSDLGASLKTIGRQLVACEIDHFEAIRAANILSQRGLRPEVIDIRAVDFFSQYQKLSKGQFAAVLGNPPFVRFQNFPEEQRERAFSIMREAGLNPNGLTNAWVPFIVASTRLLNDTGRLAMVVPAELLQVSYASELRRFLSDSFRRITIVTFRKLAFQGVQQEVVLLLCEKDRGNSEIELLELEDPEDLHRYNPAHFPLNGFKSLDHSRQKWTVYFLDQNEINLLRHLNSSPSLVRLGDIAETDVGIVTGANDVFVLDSVSADEHGSRGFLTRIVGRSNQLDGIFFTRNDLRLKTASGHKTYLLDIPPTPISRLPDNLQRYIKSAAKLGYDSGYKCRIRKFWYSVPSVYAPDAFLLRQIHTYPKLILNGVGAACTDTIHRVRFKQELDRPRFVGAFLNSLTFAYSEVLGRSYGGGVLELEPSEANSLAVPGDGYAQLDPKRLDSLLRSQGIDAVLAITNKVLTRSSLNLSPSDIKMLTSIWSKLRARRLGRKTPAGELLKLA